MNLLIRIGRYQRKHDIADTKFGKLATGDSGLMKRMKREDSEMKPATVAKIKAYLDRNGG